MSHYFISYIASSLLLLGGFPSTLSTVVKPLKIELPHSLVHVVICWNIPMHFWLKTCTLNIQTIHIIHTCLKFYH